MGDSDSAIREAAQEMGKVKSAKAWITRHLKALTVLETAGTLNGPEFTKVFDKVQLQIDKLIDSDGIVSEIYSKYKVSSEFEPISKGITDAIDRAQVLLDEFAAKAKGQVVAVAGTPPEQISKADLLDVVTQMGNNSIKVNVDCPTFNGDESDKLEFKNWLTQFESIVNSKTTLTEEFKVAFLKQKVRKNAASFIHHLEGGRPGVYNDCIKALKEQYLDEPFIINEYFRKLLAERPEYDETYGKSRNYIANVRNHLYNLKTHYKIDLLNEEHGAHQLLSHIIFSKLSAELQQAFAWELKTYYPTFNQILASYSKVITYIGHDPRKTKFINKSVKDLDQRKLSFNPSGHRSQFQTYNSRYRNKLKSEPNYSTNIVSSPKFDKKHCRFCLSDAHNSLHCNNYTTHKVRMDRVKELQLCPNCTSPDHKVDVCYGTKKNLFRSCKYCSSKEHVAALCPKYEKTSQSVHACLSTHIGQKSNYLLPVITVVLQNRCGSKVTFNALLDTGSSRSYINPKISRRLAICSTDVRNVEYEVRTFLGSGVKKLGETCLKVHFPSGRYLSLPIFVDQTFKLELEVRGLQQLVSNLNKLNYPLGADYPTNSDRMQIDGLIGIDLLQFMQFVSVPCMHGQAFKVANKFIPFGNSDHFLYSGQVGGYSQSPRIENNYATIMSNVKCSDHLVNVCIEPEVYYDDGLAPFFDSSSVERNLERMINCDSIGTNESQDISSYDLDKVRQFESGIEVSDYVYVELVWKENVSEVPANYQVALKVLDRVSAKLSKTGYLDRYNEVFFDQLNKGIIEEFTCAPNEFCHYVWLPHRPVIKDEDQTTTKIRPVFNASLKTHKDKPSLNEASYQGVNIMANMLHMLLKFRTNSKVLLGDLEKAFLQIKLKLLRDKNKFCFFLKDGDKIRCFRYNTLLFGYVCSPFILNYVLRHIAGLYPEDDCTHIMRSCFFVDNLVTTSNSSEKLISLYKECSARLSDVHFNLYSCNTNCHVLRDVMIADDKFIKHNNPQDKVLGYKYDAAVDKLFLSPVSLDADVNTKRKIFSQSAKIFDPLGFCSPIYVRSKLLIADLWEETGNSAKHWDIPVSQKSKDTWSKLAKDLNLLSTLGFERQAFNSDMPMDLFIFSDASQRAYGYVVYSLQNGDSNLVFAKPRSAPLKQKRTLPQLELLASKLSLEGLLNLLSCFTNVKKVYLGVDAQIVLAWLTSPISTKNVYTANRIKDTVKFMSDVKRDYNIDVQLKFVPTQENPADLLTRGLNFQQFLENMEFWLKGPLFIRTGGDIVWPSAELNCLSEASKTVVMHTLVDGPRVTLPPLVPFQKISKLTKLIGIVKLVVLFLIKKKVLREDTMKRLWGTTEPLEIAGYHLTYRMQEESFTAEISFLRFHNITLPDRVRDLNLFLDSRGILRSQGRMDNANAFNQDLIHPIMLGKKHPFTNLIIKFCHSKVQHLSVQPTLNRVREDGFRLIHPISSVRQVLRTCYICRRMNSLSFKYPKMTDLPSHRVNLIRPFAHTGIDYTGHIIVREGEVDCKYYMLIFSCLNVRACHIELLPDMSAEQFVYALIRFSNQYGIPETLYSDNAATFSAGAMKLNKVFTSPIYQEHFGTSGIRHLCIPLGAPWVGSCWERTIGIIKGCLKKVIGRQRLDYFKYVTILSDIQHAVNSRPLTYRCAENSSLEVITPMHFINPYGGNTILIKNSFAPFPRAKSAKELSESLTLRDQLLDKFKEIWHREYLLSLRDSYRDLRQENFTDKIKVGEICLLRNIKPELIKRRQYWSLVRVLNVIRGHDGLVRSAKVLKGCANYLSRKRDPEVHPIKHLYPLELSLTHEYNIPLPTIADLPEDDPGLDYGNIEECDDSFDASDTAACEPDGMQEYSSRSATIPSEINTLPLIDHSDKVLTPPVQVTRSGRKVIPPSFYHN